MMGRIPRYTERIKPLSILWEILYSKTESYLGMDTASANLWMKSSACSSTYLRNEAGAGIVSPGLGIELEIRRWVVVDKSERE